MNDIVTIPGRDIVVLLQNEGKRKPAIQALIDNVANLTDEEIDGAKVPMKWYRVALKQLRKASQYKQTYAQTEAAMVGHVVAGVVADPPGSIREWCSGSVFIEIEKGQLEVRDGTLAWFPNTGGVWIDTLFSSKIDPRFASSRFVRHSTKSEYSAELRAKRNQSHANVPSTVDGEPQQNPLFRIQRL